MLCHDGAAVRPLAAYGEVRTIVYFRVRELELGRLLPPGWRVVVAPEGPARGANLRITFTETIMALDAAGRPAARPPAFASFVVAAVDERGGVPEPMIVASFVDGPVGTDPGATSAVDVAARSEVRRCTTRGHGAGRMEEDWSFVGEDGDHLSLGLGYEPGPLQHARPEFVIHSAAGPAERRVYRVEQVQDWVMSRPTGLDRTRRLDVVATGTRLSSLFGGGLDVVALATLPWTRREVLPASAAASLRC